MSRFTRQDHLGIALLAMVVVALVASFAVQTAVSERDRRLERQDLDPTQSVTRSTLVLVDVTDSLSAAQIDAVRDRVGELERFELHAGEFLGVCSMGRYADGDVRSWFRGRVPDRRVNPLFQTLRRRQARVDSIFTHPLDRALDQALRPSTSSRTSLAGSIREATELSGFGPEIPIRRFLIASDLLENGTTFSMYRARLDSTLQAPPGWFQENQADLHGVEVEVLEVPRPGLSVSERSSIRRFWDGFFEACGASSVRFRRLP